MNVFHLVSKSFSAEANWSTLLRLCLQSYNIISIIPRDFTARYGPVPCHHLHFCHSHLLGLQIHFILYFSLLISGSWPPNSWVTLFLRLKPPSLWYFVRATLADWYSLFPQSYFPCLRAMLSRFSNVRGSWPPPPSEISNVVRLTSFKTT